MMGLLLSNIRQHAVHLHSDHRVHNGGFLIVHFRQLLRWYDLMMGGGHIMSDSCLQPREQRREQESAWVSAGETPDHDVEHLVLQPVSPRQGDGVKLGVHVSHKVWLQDVAALSVDQESALVYIHVCAACLEV